MEIRKADGVVTAIESPSLRLVYAAWALVLGLFAFVAVFLVSERPLLWAVVGTMFLASGAVLASTAETRTTTIAEGNATITVEYHRTFGSKRWVRRLTRSNLRKLDLVKGRYRTSIYLDTHDDEQIEIGSRSRKANATAPLQLEATDIANRLNIAVNIVSLMNVKDAAQNFYNPRDRMGVLLQRPTQAQLDEWARIPPISTEGAPTDR